MIRKIIAAAAAGLLASPTHALEGVAMEAGRASAGDVNMLRGSLQWQSSRRWLSWDLSFGGWTGGHGRVYDLGFTPTARLGRSPYFEAGVGAHVFSDLDVGTGSELSTRFQFGDHIGAGVRFGHYDLGVRFQHLSNGGLRNPNPGINFLILRLQYYPG